MCLGSERRNKTALLLLCGFLLPVLTFAQTKETQSSASKSGYWNRFEVGHSIYSGKIGESLAGAKDYFLLFGRERLSGLIRPFWTIRLHGVPASNLKLSSASSDLSSTSAVFVNMGLGAQIFLNRSDPWAAFAGAEAFYSRASLDITSAPAGTPAVQRANLWGYEVSVGFDIRRTDVGGHGRPRLRIRLAYATEQGSLVGFTRFQSTTFRFSLGI